MPQTLFLTSLLWLACLFSIGLMGIWPDLGAIAAFTSLGALATLRITDMGIINFALGATLIITAAFYLVIG